MYDVTDSMLPQKYHQKTSRIDQQFHKNGRIRNQLTEISSLSIYKETGQERNIDIIPFVIVSKQIKHLEINLTKNMKDFYSEIFKFEKGRLRKILENGETSHAR